MTDKTVLNLSGLERLLAEMQWQDIETAPRDAKTWIEVGRRSEGSPSGWWVATAVLFPELEEAHWTAGDTILHYNGDALVAGFRGPLTHWRPLRPPAAARTHLPALIERARMAEQLKDLAIQMAHALVRIDRELSGRVHSTPALAALANGAALLSAARSAGLIEETAPGHTDLMISPEGIDEALAEPAPETEGRGR